MIQPNNMSKYLDEIKQQKAVDSKDLQPVFTPIEGKEYLVDGNNQKRLCHMFVMRMGNDCLLRLMEESELIMGAAILPIGTDIHFNTETTKFYEPKTTNPLKSGKWYQG